MEYSRIKFAIKARGVTLESVCTEIGMTPPGLAKALENHSLRLRDFEGIARCLGMTVRQLLDEVVEEPARASEASPTYGRPKYIEDRVGDLEQRMKALERKCGGGS